MRYEKLKGIDRSNKSNGNCCSQLKEVIDVENYDTKFN